MRQYGKRLTSSDVVSVALKQGVELSSQKPQSVVASILSHNELFDNGFDHRGIGYGLKEWLGETGTAAPPPDQAPLPRNAEPPSGSPGPAPSADGLLDEFLK